MRDHPERAECDFSLPSPRGRDARLALHQAIAEARKSRDALTLFIARATEALEELG